MSTFTISWIVAGFCIGWMGIDLAGGLTKLRVPLLWNFASGFIGALVAYTIFQ